MSFSIKDATSPQIRSFLERIDQSSIGNGDGQIDDVEASEASAFVSARRSWRREAFEAFGIVPRSGEELRRFAEQPPREEALERILGQSRVAGMAARTTSGRGNRVPLGTVSELGKTFSVSITPGGRVAYNDKLPTNLKELGTAIYHAARRADSLGPDVLNEATQRRLFGTLSDALDVSQTGRRTISRERLFAGSMTLLLHLAKTLDPAEQGDLREAVIDRALQALHEEDDPKLQSFYFQAFSTLKSKMDPAQKVALKEIKDLVLPKAPPVEEYTAGRTKPLVVEHTIHEEFWEEEISLYKDLGWKLVKQNSKDTHRVYEGELPDPNGEKAPLKVRVTVNKGELDFLSGMSDPDNHVVIYSGHSALGGNGSQAINDAGHASGLPKTVLISNCRGKDNYAEFANKFPRAMLIATEDPTYSDSGQLRVRAMYDMLAGGDTFASMRNKTRVRFWDEKANNYIYPDERRRFRYTDFDADGRTERTVLGSDPLFNIEKRRNLSDFNRAIAFVNTELYYHWELEHEMGRSSTYGKKYFDHVIPDGSIDDPEPGELVRVEAVERKVGGRTETFYRVQADPNDLGGNRDLYAGKVTAHTMMAIAEHSFGELEPFEAMRSVLAGAQAIYYLDVYENTASETMAEYFKEMGLGDLDPKDVYAIFEQFDSHVNDEQTDAFCDLLEGRYNLSLDEWKVPQHD